MLPTPCRPWVVLAAGYGYKKTPMDEQIEARKADHLRLSAAGDVDALVGPGWDDVRLVHEALPELDQSDVDLSTEFFGHRLRAPLLIAGMTGGHAAARDVNAVLARAASAPRCGDPTLLTPMQLFATRRRRLFSLATSAHPSSSARATCRRWDSTRFVWR